MQDGRRPSFVIIYLDDLGYGDLGCFGSPEARTPHIDGIAADGALLTGWYSNCPACSPSRASLLTGLYPERTGVRNILGGQRGSVHGLDPSCRTMARLLKDAGYQTALFGKWHLGTSPECLPSAHGFDEFFGFLAGCVDYYSHIFYWGMRGGRSEGIHDLWENGREVWDNGRYLTETIGERAVRFIDGVGDDPFLLYLPFNAPHYPMHAPKEYLDRFPDVPEDRRIMHAMVAAVDDAVGRVVDALKRAGRYEDTLIFFSSDNGPSDEHANWLNGRTDPYTGGSAGPFRGYKGSLFDGGIHMPAIMSWPGRIPAGSRCDGLGVMMDVVPTVLAAAGMDPTGTGLDGRNALPMIAAGKGSQHDQVFWDYNGQLAVRRGKWKLILDGKLDFDRKIDDAVFLADLDADPGEQTNLAEKHPDTARELEKLARDWRERTAPE